MYIAHSIICILSCFYFVKGDSEYWYDTAQEILHRTLRRTENRNVAKNVILIIGDGMSLATIAAARVLKGQKAGRPGTGEKMLYESFPNVGLARTYAVNKYVPDSASTATAFLCGVKTKFWTVGSSDEVQFEDCKNYPGKEVKCIGEWALAEGKSVGLVTNTRVTHATPAPIYSHSPSRHWEYDAKIKSKKDRSRCKDIARQLVEDYPGKQIQVVLGGGREGMMANGTFDPEYPEKRGLRTDNRHLIEQWRNHKQANKLPYKYVWNKEEFDKVDPSTTDYLLGLFEPSHMYDVMDRAVQSQYSDFEEPALSEMAEKAIRILSRNPKGFFLLVEGGLIDRRHHLGKAVRAVHEALDFENAVSAAMNLTSREDTLLVVSSDHSHGMNFVGYASAGEDLFGASEISDVDGKPYTSLMYSSGPGFVVSPEGRQDITGINTASKDYLQQATVPRVKTAHSGDDVGVYAIGPMGHLFTGVYDQHYVAHAMAYAACIGRNKEHCSPAGSQYRTAGRGNCIGKWSLWWQILVALLITVLY